MNVLSRAGGKDGRIEIWLVPASNNQMTVRLDGTRETADIDPGPESTLS